MNRPPDHTHKAARACTHTVYARLSRREFNWCHEKNADTEACKPRDQEACKVRDVQENVGARTTAAHTFSLVDVRCTRLQQKYQKPRTAKTPPQMWTATGGSVRAGRGWHRRPLRNTPKVRSSLLRPEVPLAAVELEPPPAAADPAPSAAPLLPHTPSMGGATDSGIARRDVPARQEGWYTGPDINQVPTLQEGLQGGGSRRAEHIASPCKERETWCLRVYVVVAVCKLQHLTSTCLPLCSSAEVSQQR